ncbi:hypothetical protein PPIS_b6000 [Pseudoalteromonas piscicida]|uniref:Uncharacterized protein n=1 Tax=Pseudoalteromonas piscicida TaxID=43662 RepID=A0ABM6NL09_PSEO7|nr:hypothetical protein PPIS_b6000 [Pseudoalteromonas piscicida]
MLSINVLSFGQGAAYLSSLFLQQFDCHLYKAEPA